MTDNVTVTKVINQVQIASDGPQGPTGPTGATGPSGVISVTAPITNSGTSTSAVIGINAGVAGGVATLDGTGKVPQNQLPAVAITNTFVVNSQAAMLALTAEEGDVAVRTDLNKTYILAATPASTLGNWQELLTPTDAVQSVDGRTGTVTLSDLYAAKTHAATHASGGTDAVTLAQSQITNLTTDLAAKAPLASPTFTGTVTIPAGSSISGVPYLATANTFTAIQTISSTYSDSNVGRTLRLRHSTGGSVGITLDPVSVTADGSVYGVIALNGSTLDLINAPSAQIKMYRSASAAAGTMILQTRYGGDSLLKDRITIPDNAPILFASPQVAVATVVARGLASQTADLLQIQDSSTNLLANISSAGVLTLWANDGANAHRTIFTANSSGIILNSTRSAGTASNFIIQTDGSERFSVSAGGAAQFTNTAAAAVGLIVRGAASQTADIQQWQSSAGTVLARVTSAGAIVSASSVTATSFATSSTGFQAGVFNSGGYIRIEKATASATTGSTTAAQLFLLTGTNANTVKLVIRSNGAETTILDNIPTA